MVYKIDKDIFFVKAGASQELSLQPSMTLKVSGTGGGADEMIKPAISFKFPATPPIPLFQVDPMPKIGSRWGGEFSMKSFHQVGTNEAGEPIYETEDDRSAHPHNNCYQDNILLMARNAVNYMRNGNE